MEAPKVTTQHEWLARLAGEWKSEMEIPARDGQPGTIVRGVESGRMVGDLWLMLEGRGEMPSQGTHHSVMTLGFEPATCRFVGSWVGSMMNHFWMYNGELDGTGKVLTLESEGPRFDKPSERTQYRDVITLLSDSHRTLTGMFLTPEGEWQEMMVVHYHRV